MKRVKTLELSVGFFVLLGLLAFVFLAFKISGLSGFNGGKSYRVTAEFTNIGDLKVRAPVSIAGVKIGEVAAIDLDPGSFAAKVTLNIFDEQKNIPLYDTSARILTEGLLGSNYISIVPGFEEEEAGREAKYLQEGSSIEKTQEAIILENLIGQLLFNINK